MDLPDFDANCKPYTGHEVHILLQLSKSTDINLVARTPLYRLPSTFKLRRGVLCVFDKKFPVFSHYFPDSCANFNWRRKIRRHKMATES